MTTNTPAPAHEAVVTDDEIIALEIEVGGTFTLGPVPFARAIESALLSKLRAPVAGPVVAWMTEDGRVATDETKRTGMASTSRVNFNIPLVRAALASAPVAGEAQKRDEQLRKAVATFLKAYCARYGGIYGQIKKRAPLQDEVLGLVFASREAPPSDDAAPQASEAVRPSEDIVILAREGVRVNKPGSPEHAVCVEMVKLARALKAYPSDALSAQPGAQNEGRGLCLDTQRPAP
ncbi:MAG: hypothetical protein E2591_00545 [Achromobacter sp.]|uniref:hypothetical protein n=1 Tax=Achromobacter sp. TaxID=134375 RepID=UPI0012C44B86|nr:hypothetical protein [Achromobacter sp.]